MKIGLYLTIIIFLFSCSSSDKKEKKSQFVVEFQGQKLSKKELQLILPPNYTKEDSLNIAEAYIKNWLQKKITVQNAKNYISEQEKRNLNLQTEQYKEDLLLNKFYNKKLEKLNENEISENEIKEYFNANQNSFILNEDIVKAHWVIASPSLKTEIENHFYDTIALLDIQKKYPETQLSFNKDWNSLLQLKTQLELDNSSETQTQLLSKNMFSYQKNNTFYALKVQEFIPKSKTGPYTYFKNTIKSILINKRKLNLQKQIEDSLYENAIQNNKITYYE